MLDHDGDKLSSLAPNRFGANIPSKWKVPCVEATILDKRRLHENSGLWCSSACSLQRNFYPSIVMGFREKSELTSTSDQYVTKLLHQRILTSSVWQPTDISDFYSNSPIISYYVFRDIIPVFILMSSWRRTSFPNKTWSKLRFTKNTKLFFIEPKPTFHIEISVWGESYDQKVGKLRKGNPTLKWINIARSKSALAILRHLIGLDRNVIKRFRSSRPRVNPVINNDVSYFVSVFGCPAAKQTTSFQ